MYLSSLYKTPVQNDDLRTMQRLFFSAFSDTHQPLGFFTFLSRRLILEYRLFRHGQKKESHCGSCELLHCEGQHHQNQWLQEFV